MLCFDWSVLNLNIFRLVQDLGVDTQVAQHLSATYGDRAFSVGKMAQLTGMRWPIVGRRIHVDLPYIDAEVRNIFILSCV